MEILIISKSASYHVTQHLTAAQRPLYFVTWTFFKHTKKGSKFRHYREKQINIIDYYEHARRIVNASVLFCLSHTCLQLFSYFDKSCHVTPVKRACCTVAMHIFALPIVLKWTFLSTCLEESIVALHEVKMKLSCQCETGSRRVRFHIRY